MERRKNVSEYGGWSDPEAHFATRFWSIGQELLGGPDSQAEAVRVEVCVSLPEIVICVAFTPGQLELASAHSYIS